MVDGLSEFKIVELKKRYHIKVRYPVDGLIEEHGPGQLDKPSYGFEDIVNFF